MLFEETFAQVQVLQQGDPGLSLSLDTLKDEFCPWSHNPEY